MIYNAIENIKSKEDFLKFMNTQFYVGRIYE